MKVVLLDNVKGIGRLGDVKEVSDGYARNFLFPHSLGKPATEKVIRDVEAIKASRLVSTELEHKQLLELAGKIEGMTVDINGKANEKGTLFSGITPADIAAKISEQAGVRIPESVLTSHEHLKHVGSHTVELNLVDSVVSSVTVNVRAL